MQNNLPSLGFRRIGNSAFFRQGTYIITQKPDGTFEIWKDLLGDAFRNGGQFLALHSWHDERSEGNDVIRAGFLKYDWTNTLLWQEAGPNACNYTGSLEVMYLSPDQQVSKAGFTSYSGTSVFKKIDTRRVGDSEYRFEYIVTLENGKITSLAKPGYVDPNQPVLRVLGYQEKPGRFEDETEEYLQVANNLMEFAIGSYGIAYGSQKVTRELTAAEIGLYIPKYELTQPIESITHIAGQSIAELEQRMQPNNYSQSGFIGKNESLLAVLEIDNRYVRACGLKHSDLAYPLLYTVTFMKKGLGNTFVLKGVPYSLQEQGSHGPQQSPFHDTTPPAQSDVQLTNQKTGYQIKFSEMVPDFIARYGFYEGSVPYRLSPRQIIEVFLLK